MDTAARANFGEALFKRIKLATDAEIPGLDHMLREINGTWPSVKGAAHELDFAESLGFNNIRNSGQMEFQLGPNPQRAIDIVYEGRYYELKNITSWDSTEQLAYYLDNLSDAQAKNLYYVFRGSENNTILNAFKSALKASTDNQEIIDAIIKNVKWYGELY